MKMVALALIFVYALVSTVVMYAVEEGASSRQQTMLEVASINSSHVVVKNTGNSTASSLSSKPPANFTPSSIEPGEKAVGKFDIKLYSYTNVHIESREGSSIDHTYKEE